MEEVILVNEADEAIGKMEKLEAHEKGLLHRAFSVFVFNSKKEMLMQQRAAHKYHSAGLWSNTCCSHPRPGENTLTAAKRRLNEEMGLVLELENQFSFIYKTTFGNGLTEHEYDHVYFGYTDEDPKINPEEVSDYKWQSVDELRELLKKKPEIFSFWFKIAFEKIFKI
ncbi:MAG: isopentenyl-diphosphate Delta-isomerase [Bacteroidia bacterium]|nr:isopentenyl-diphosphate Delta-isomerase [Bacteroidia bacterium]